MAGLPVACSDYRVVLHATECLDIRARPWMGAKLASCRALLLKSSLGEAALCKTLLLSLSSVSSPATHSIYPDDG